MAHGQAGEGDACRLAWLADGKGWHAYIGTIVAGTYFVRQAGDVFDQTAHFGGRLAAIQRRHQLDGALELFEVGGELGFDIGFKHDVLRNDR